MARLAPLTCRTDGPSAGNVRYLGAARCRHKFELYYPEGFADAAYLVAERAARERAHRAWQHGLGAQDLRHLLAHGAWRAAADTAQRIEARAGLLSRHERMALREALRPVAAARLFAHALYAFLYERGGPRRRFEDWLGALAELRARSAGTRVLTWPVATAFGFLGRPDRHLLFKPQATRAAARAYGFDLRYDPTPGWRGYESLLTFAAIIRRDLARHPGLQARDMLDVQAFIWVQGAPDYAA
jgi:hypothetical protein